MDYRNQFKESRAIWDKFIACGVALAMATLLLGAMLALSLREKFLWTLPMAGLMVMATLACKAMVPCLLPFNWLFKKVAEEDADVALSKGPSSRGKKLLAAFAPSAPAARVAKALPYGLATVLTLAMVLEVTAGAYEYLVTRLPIGKPLSVNSAVEPLIRKSVKAAPNSPPTLDPVKFGQTLQRFTGQTLPTARAAMGSCETITNTANNTLPSLAQDPKAAPRKLQELKGQIDVAVSQLEGLINDDLVPTPIQQQAQTALNSLSKASGDINKALAQGNLDEKQVESLGDQLLKDLESAALDALAKLLEEFLNKALDWLFNELFGSNSPFSIRMQRDANGQLKFSTEGKGSQQGKSGQSQGQQGQQRGQPRGQQGEPSGQPQGQPGQSETTSGLTKSLIGKIEGELGQRPVAVQLLKSFGKNVSPFTTGIGSDVGAVLPVGEAADEGPARDGKTGLKKSRLNLEDDAAGADSLPPSTVGK